MNYFFNYMASEVCIGIVKLVVHPISWIIGQVLRKVIIIGIDKLHASDNTPKLIIIAIHAW